MIILEHMTSATVCYEVEMLQLTLQVHEVKRISDNKACGEWYGWLRRPRVKMRRVKTMFQIENAEEWICSEEKVLKRQCGDSEQASGD